MPSLTCNDNKTANKILLLDTLQDPGNVGAIIRTAESFGVDLLIVSSDCADVLSQKVIRASMGSVFRVKIQISEDLSATIKELTSNGYTTFAAMLDDQAEKLNTVTFPDKSAVVIGSEGRGISPAVAQSCERKVYIPITGAQSLNAAAAAAVIMYCAMPSGI